MGLRTAVASVVLVFGLFGCEGHLHSGIFEQGGRSDCRFDSEYEVSVAASVADKLELRAGAGGLKVEGREGLDQVRATARACASDMDYLDELEVTLRREGDDIILTTHYPDLSGLRFGNDVAQIDLVVEIPLGMAVEIEDSSGSMEVSGTGDLRIEDSSGSIDVAGISGAVDIDDSSGSLKVEDVAGDVAIEDGSGSIQVRNIQGALHLRDGSGSIEVVDVGQDVVVERDGSGSINVRDVRGDFTVRRDGSGRIRYSNVEGNVQIPRRKS